MFRFLLALVLFSQLANAQVKPVYYQGKNRVSDKEKADSYAVMGKITGEKLWFFKKYDLDDALMATGSYKDEKGTIKHGTFVYYLDAYGFDFLYKTSYNTEKENRFKYIEGEYADGLKTGIWNIYYPTGALKSTANFNKNLRDGSYESFSEKGEMLTKGNYLLGKKEGQWLSKGGKISEIYANNKLVSRSNVKRITNNTN